MTREKRLGRGLEALLSQAPPPAAAQDQSAQTTPVQLSVYEIDRNPYQPRRQFNDEEIASLAASIGEHGLLQPVVVRKVGERYQLISGERRLRAAIVAGLKEVPIHRRDADDRETAELAIVENLQRKDLDPIEKASSFRRYLDDYGCTQEQLAGRLGIDRSTIANLIRLLDLPEPVQHQIEQGAITQGHARALLPLGDEVLQSEFCRRIEAEELSVRATERLVQETLRAEDSRAEFAVVGAGGAPKSAAARSPQVAELEDELAAALGAKVEIRQTARGGGRIIVTFKNADEYDRLHGYLTDPTVALGQSGLNQRREPRPRRRRPSLRRRVPVANRPVVDYDRESCTLARYGGRAKRSGRSAVWLAHLLWEQGVGGSNPLAPT